MRHLPAAPNWALLFALVLLAALVYLPGLSGDFLFDDYPNVVGNQAVHMESLDRANLKQAAAAYQAGSYGRPLATVWFGIDYLIGGKDPYTFKVSGLIVHLVNTALVFLLVLRLLSLPSTRWERPALSAAAIAAIWAIHPLQVSSVLYIVQRMETLATTFVLLALLAYLRGRANQLEGRPGWSWISGSALLAAVGLLSKETAILFPLFAVLLEVTVLQFAARSASESRSLRGIHIVVLGTGLLGFVLFIMPTYLAEAAYASRPFSMFERLLTQLRVLPMYLGQILWPTPESMSFYYDHFPKSTGLLSPVTTLFGGLFLAGLVAATVFLRKRAPLIALGIGWFLAAHALTSNIINLELVFEHRNYFALLGVLLVVGDLARRIPTPDGPTVVIAAVSVVIIGVASIGAIRSATWGDPFNLAEDLASLAPESSRAANDLATLYYGMADGNPQSPFFQFATRTFERSRLLPSATILPEQGLILMSASADQPANPIWWDSLADKVRTQPLGPETLMALVGLLREHDKGASIDSQRLNEALRIAFDRGVQHSSLHVAYGMFLLRTEEDDSDAVDTFLAAIHAEENNPTYITHLLGLLIDQGHTESAQQLLARVEKVGIALPYTIKLDGGESR